MIFLVLAGKTLEENLEAIDLYKASIDGIEVRADYLASPLSEDWARFFEQAAFPAILTVRKPEDGGRWDAPEKSREEIFLRLIEAGGFSYIDLEENADLPEVEKAAAEKKLTVIRSLHDFAGVPENLPERLAGLPRNEGEIPKAAVMPRSCRDLERIIDAFTALREGLFRGRRNILLGMGEFGFPTRVLAPLLGSFLTFASPRGAQTAPGLIDPETLDRVYRYHKIGPATRIFGIIGNPILHSRSPHIHNPAYDRLGIDAVYVPFHTDRAAEFLPIINKLGIGGLSVTVPFKEEVIPFCRWVEEAVRVIGACNTLVPGPEGLSGYNTDAEGFLAPLRGLFAGDAETGFPKGLRAAVVGAGGAARSVVYALVREGAQVLILNRTPERAKRLAEDIEKALDPGPSRLRPAALDAAGLAAIAGYRDLIVNTTTMGMHPWQDQDPLAEYEFTGREIVYDIVYNPRETLLLKRALRAGCRVIYGDAMLMAQACRQFLLYTGREYPASAPE